MVRRPPDEVLQPGLGRLMLDGFGPFRIPSDPTPGQYPAPVRLIRCRCCWLSLALLLLAQDLLAQSMSGVRIGVLAGRGRDLALANWGPTADYLRDVIVDHDFRLVPMEHDEIGQAVQTGTVDFILVNPGMYVSLEQQFRISRIATLSTQAGNLTTNLLGSVIFRRVDRVELRELGDLRGKRMAAVHKHSFGGFQIAWRTLLRHKVDPMTDLARLDFLGTQDAVVAAVREGRADVGIVRTGILEGLNERGQESMLDFEILNPQAHTEFFLAHSTELYPEWPFSKLQHTPNSLAQAVAVALLQMPRDHPAALASGHAGWTVPLDYQPVHELLRELHLNPYSVTGQFTLEDALKRYWVWVLVGISVLLATILIAVAVIRLNRQLARSKRHLEQRHELILNSVAEGIYGVDLAGNSTFVNHAMERITGWKARELIGLNSHQMFHHTRVDGDPHPSDECPVYKTSRSSQAVFVQNDVFWRKDGSPVPVEYSSTPILDKQGDPRGAVVVFRDISERLQSEDESRQHQADLAHMGRLSTMGEMASGIAHELNQPLAAIVTNSQACIRMLDSGMKDTTRLADVLERIAGQADRAANIIRQLRRFVRKDEPESVPVQINELIDGVMVLFEPEARRLGVKIRLDLGEGLPVVSAQHIQIEQVILNLCRNAIEAMSENHSDQPRMLSLHTRVREGRTLRVVVRDTGPGLSDEVRDRLFDPFITTKEAGMGLGLSISKAIVESHRGSLGAADVDDGQGGTEFFFELPIDEWNKNNG